MRTLGNTAPVAEALPEHISVHHGDGLVMICQHPGGEQATDAGTDDYGAPTGSGMDVPTTRTSAALDRGHAEAARRYSAFISSAARSPMTTQGAIVFALVILGMMDPSATRRFSTP